MTLAEGRVSYNLGKPFIIRGPSPWTPPRCLGQVGRLRKLAGLCLLHADMVRQMYVFHY